MTKNQISRLLRLPAALQHPHGRSVATNIPKTLYLALLAAALTSHAAIGADRAGQSFKPSLSLAVHQDAGAPAIPAARNQGDGQPKRANFQNEIASSDARHIADWVIDSSDNRGMPFMIIDKAEAKVFVFDPFGQLIGASSALLGLAVGDDSVHGIGNRKLSSILPAERTTPAGRFVVALDRNLQGHEILWVDYDAAISLHRVVTSNARERRAERLMSPSVTDNRISYGCINVPVKFYEHVVSPAFKKTDGIVYVLPETRSPRETFGSYDVDERASQ